MDTEAKFGDEWEFEIEMLLPAHADARKMVPRRFSGRGTNVYQAICERHSTPRLRDPVQLLCALIVLTDPTKSQMPASCFTTRAKSTQHKCKDRAVLFGHALILHSRFSKSAQPTLPLRSCLSILHLRGMACSHENPEKWGFCLLG